MTKKKFKSPINGLPGLIINILNGFEPEAGEMVAALHRSHSSIDKYTAFRCELSKMFLETNLQIIDLIEKSLGTDLSEVRSQYFDLDKILQNTAAEEASVFWQ